MCSENLLEIKVISEPSYDGHCTTDLIGFQILIVVQFQEIIYGIISAIHFDITNIIDIYVKYLRFVISSNNSINVHFN